MPEHTPDEWTGFWGWATGQPGGSIITQVPQTAETDDDGVAGTVLDALDPWGILRGVYSSSQTVTNATKGGVSGGAVDKAATAFGSVLGIATVAGILYLVVKLK